MSGAALSELIRQKALEAGFDDCGIVRIGDLRGYEELLDSRISDLPSNKPMLEGMRKYAKPDAAYDWAKSVIVCVTRYGKFKVPEKVEGLIGKYYLYDHKLQATGKTSKAITELEAYLGQQGVRFAKEIHGVTSMRFAATKAGLGVIRRNNFLYTEGGSWVLLDTWVIDADVELVRDSGLAPCPEGCTECVDACPTKALSKPYCTDMLSCVTRLTWTQEMTPEPMRDKMGAWIYGCDACQNACPMNKGAWKGEEVYPGLDGIGDLVSPEAIMDADDDTLTKKLTPKFWFVRPEFLWKWRVNALRSMANSYEPKYEAYLRKAMESDNANVREMAGWACEKVGLEIA